jgi:hypothetical protein
MPTLLGARPAAVPLPTGVGYKKLSPGNGPVAWPPQDNWIAASDTVGGETTTFNRPERFWLKAGACIIARSTGAWTRYDYKLRLVVNGAYGNDLNGTNAFQKATSNENHTDGWWGHSIEGLYYCEANTNYVVYLLSDGGGAGCQYYQHQVHWHLWAYTIGEGVY